MKKILCNGLMVMMLTIIAAMFTACSKDDEPGAGSMSGWVKIDGKKYDFSYFYGGQFDNGLGYGINGFNIDPYKLSQSTKYNMCAFSIELQSDGTWIPVDPVTGEKYFSIEFEIEVNPETNTCSKMLVSWDNLGLDGVSITKKGNNFVIDGKSVKVRYSENDSGVSSQNPVTTVDFHFEGAPKYVEFDDED